VLSECCCGAPTLQPPYPNPLESPSVLSRAPTWTSLTAASKLASLHGHRRLGYSRILQICRCGACPTALECCLPAVRRALHLSLRQQPACPCVTADPLMRKPGPRLRHSLTHPTPPALLQATPAKLLRQRHHRMSTQIRSMWRCWGGRRRRLWQRRSGSTCHLQVSGYSWLLAEYWLLAADCRTNSPSNKHAKRSC
jgi:hypothetical protein